MYNRLIIMVFAVIFCLNASNVAAQLNLKVGYNLNYSSFQTYNKVLQEFNDKNPWLSQDFKDLRLLNGLQIGARVRGEYVGMDLTWERSAASRKIAGQDPDGLDYVSELNFKWDRASMGLETYYEYFGLGASIYWERLGISRPITSIESNEQILTDNRIGNKIYLIFSTIGVDRVSLSLQPYVAIPWSHYNLGALATHLDISTQEGLIQENLHFGFSFVFYNGRQR